jgi:hypothetical protein
VIVAGWSRLWNYSCRQTYTAVGIVPDEKGVMNGVLIPLSNAKDLARLDIRESEYERVLVDPDTVFLLLDGQTQAETLRYPAGAKIWTYASRTREHMPSPAIPLAQSYLDCVLQGARVTLGEDFARLFTRLTDWEVPSSHGYWVDDRIGSAERSGRTSPTSNGLINVCAEEPLQPLVKPMRRYAGREIDHVDTEWIDALLQSELGAIFQSRVVDRRFN